jgi:hypothetical protein
MSGIGTTKYQLYIKGIKGENISIIVHKDATIDEFFVLLEQKTGIPPREARLIHAGKELEQSQGKRISDYPSIMHGSNLFMVMRLLGGQDQQQPPPKELDDLVDLTDEPDMITWDDDPEGKRAKMPCGHAIAPESLTTYCRSLLSAGKFIFLCPYVDPTNITKRCNKEWSYIEVRRFGVLSDDEQKEFETKISENYLKKAMGIQECPGCESLCERMNPKDKRLTCRICTKEKGRRFDFCWHCLHEWRDSGTEKCGNEECSNEDHRLRILREAPEKYVVGVKTPCRRACPQCGMLIEHLAQCKHMVCRCGVQFCFICLKVKGEDGWTCGFFNTKCESAPRQTNIPGQ